MDRIGSAMRFVHQIDYNKPSYKGYWLQDDIQCFCDGYMAVILNNHIDEVEKAENGYNFNRLNIIDVIKRYDNFEIYENINLKTAKKIKGIRLYLNVSDTYFLNTRVNIVKGMLGKNIKAYTKIDEESMMKDKVLILENENGKALILCTRKIY